ncbi:MAG TPA: TIGR04283 family arsenosugar biosynthesis glycosyltransferase [Flavisolibacter sp.]|nr:TIGR04283 family arsenosugar biosynthesis glycosyltransferase [Flavisolibacter sp.]
MIGVIIPAYNEAAAIAGTIEWLRSFDTSGAIQEIIVVDGGSTDATVQTASNAGALAVASPKKGRAAQMNYGASLATSPILYFLHADTLPPASFVEDILQAKKQGYASGCFMLSFNHHHWFLRANCWFTRFDVNHFRFGDQSLFVQRAVFFKAGGFDEGHIVMEDQEIIRRLKQQGRFVVIKKPVITSARKYLENGIYKTQGIFFLIYFMYRAGYSQERLVHTYKRLIRQDKL